jgi:hypothetical protein
MQSIWSQLGAIDPRAQVEARLQAHYGLQWATRAARANLPAQPGDDQSNFGWDTSRQALVTHDWAAADGGIFFRVGLGIAVLNLFVVKGTEMVAEFELEGRTEVEAGTWIDGVLADLGLHAASGVTLRYSIPVHPVAQGGRYSATTDEAGFAGLARWFAAADDILQETRLRLVNIGSRASPVRCWPHHFDIATLLSPATGHPERVASIGIGMSPGDEYYPQPYFYVSPWPAPPVDALPALPHPGHWHTLDFVGAVATGEDVVSASEPRAHTHKFIDAAVAILRGLPAA